MEIQTLTEEQIAKFPQYAEEWLGHGLSTEPANRAQAEQGVDLAYSAAGLEPPAIKIWLDSPQQGAMAAAMLKDTTFGNQVGEQVGEQVWNQVAEQVWEQVRNQVRKQVWEQVGEQVWEQVAEQVGEQVWRQVWNQVRKQVWEQVWEQVRNQVREQVGEQVGEQVAEQVGNQVWNQVWEQVEEQVREAGYGAYDSNWLAFYQFFKQECKLSCCDKLDGLTLIAKSCGWWWPFEGAVILTERPSKIKFDDRKLLHCEDGAAIQYRDGFSIYSWHGTRIPQEWIEDKSSLTAKEALTWGNMEQRRAACEIINWHNISRELNATTIQKD